MPSIYISKCILFYYHSFPSTQPEYDRCRISLSFKNFEIGSVLSLLILKIIEDRLFMATKSCLQVCMSFAMGCCHSSCSQGKSVSLSPGIWGGPETGFDQQIM